MNNMAQELIEAARAALMRSSGPMTIGQIRTALTKEMKVPAADRFRREVQEHLAGTAGVFVWPKHGSTTVYCSRPLNACVEEALLRCSMKSR